MDLSCRPGIIDRRVCGAVRQQTDQCKYNKEKKNDTVNFFAHNYLMNDSELKGAIILPL
jgi:hypothetical protein